MSPCLRKRKQKTDDALLPNSKKNKPHDDKNNFTKKDESDHDPEEDPEEDSEEEINSEEEFLVDEINIDKNENPEAYNNLLAVKKELYRTEPNVKIMLDTPMLLEDRAKLCQYYEIYKMQAPNTNEWLEARDRYNRMFKEYKAGYEQSKKYSKKDIARMKQDEEKFTGFDAKLALKYKILNLETCKDNKEVIYRRYE
jgi:hypothetical protein